jgi:hypothetical protein
MGLIMSLPTDLKKLLRCNGSERRLLLEAFVWLGILRAAILLLPFRWIVRLLKLDPGSSPANDTLADKPFVSVVGWAIAAAAARTPWQSACLPQALCGLRMLGRRGIAAILRIGVAKSEPGGSNPLKAHAWLCCGARIVTGGRGCDRFVLLAEFTRSRCEKKKGTRLDRIPPKAGSWQRG